MSAWLCSSKHISIIVNAIERCVPHVYRSSYAKLIAEHAERARIKNGLVGSSLTDAEILFDDLLEENVKSLKGRYPDDENAPLGERIWSGADSAVYDPYAFARDVADAIKLIHSYRYQSCEHIDWGGEQRRAVHEGAAPRPHALRVGLRRRALVGRRRRVPRAGQAPRRAPARHRGGTEEAPPQAGVTRPRASKRPRSLGAFSFQNVIENVIGARNRSFSPH